MCETDEACIKIGYDALMTAFSNVKGTTDANLVDIMHKLIHQVRGGYWVERDQIGEDSASLKQPPPYSFVLGVGNVVNSLQTLMMTFGAILNRKQNECTPYPLAPSYMSHVPYWNSGIYAMKEITEEDLKKVEAAIAIISDVIDKAPAAPFPTPNELRGFGDNSDFGNYGYRNNNFGNRSPFVRPGAHWGGPARFNNNHPGFSSQEVKPTQPTEEKGPDTIV